MVNQDDLFISIAGTLSQPPKVIGQDKAKFPIVMLYVRVQSYKGVIPCKVWRGWAQMCLNELKQGDLVKVDGTLERRHYTDSKDVVHDDFVLNPTSQPEFLRGAQ